MSLRAFLSRRVVTPDAVRPAALLVEANSILDVVAPDQIPADADSHDFGDAAILPGLVDSHVQQRSRPRGLGRLRDCKRDAAAASTGYTLLVDMPLNCLPATTNVTALEAKRAAARGRCCVDWMAWGGVVADNPHDIEPLANAGVPGFKCFLVHPGIDGFTMRQSNSYAPLCLTSLKRACPFSYTQNSPAPIDAGHRKVGGCGLESLPNISAIPPRRSGTLSHSNALIRMPRIQIPPAHRPSLRQQSSSRTARRTFRGPAGNRRNLPALSASHRRGNFRIERPLRRAPPIRSQARTATQL